MPLDFVRNDITNMRVDAIVNPTNRFLYGTDGVDGAVRRIGGPELTEAAKKLAPLRAGQAKLTPGYNLPARYVIHTVGPVWRGGDIGEKEVLAACYRSCLYLAEETGCESVAFPLIGSGNYGCPREEALDVAVSVIRDFLRHSDIQVYLVVYDRESFAVSKALISEIASYISDADVAPDARPYGNAPQMHIPADYDAMPAPDADDEFAGALRSEADEAAAPPQSRPAFGRERQPVGAARSNRTLRERMTFGSDRTRRPKPIALEDDLNAFLRQQDEGFRDMLLRLIDEKGLTDAQCYKRANVDRKLFNKIKNNPGYRPTKPTVTAFVIALRLPLDQARDMLGKAGFSLTRSSRFDLIIEFFITRGCYDIDRINEVLFSFDQSLLGSGMSA